MLAHICHECGLLIAKGRHGRIIKFCYGFADDNRRPGVEGFLGEEDKYLCRNCAEKFDYDMEWEGCYYKRLPVEKDGKLKE